MRQAGSQEGTTTREQGQRKPEPPAEAQGRPVPAGQKQEGESAKETREILVSEAGAQRRERRCNCTSDRREIKW